MRIHCATSIHLFERRVYRQNTTQCNESDKCHSIAISDGRL